MSVDYYDIDVKDVIGTFSAQQTLDQCYVSGISAACASIKRVDGDLGSPAAGIQLYTTNLSYVQSEGIEAAFGFGKDFGSIGDLQVSGMVNKYLTAESQSDALTPVIDCNGYFGTTCDPLSDLQWTTRATWNWNDLSASLLWRHIDSVEIEPTERASVFEGFRRIDAYDYLDLALSYNLWDDRIRLSLTVDNITEEMPPIMGNEAGDTSSNSGNTFPSNYDVFGRMYTAGLRLTF